jgi:hypothetical protein
MLDETRFAASGGTLQHYRQATLVTLREHVDFVAEWQVIGRLVARVPDALMLSSRITAFD